MKIKDIDYMAIEFDNGSRIVCDHDQNCCEDVYADFEQIDDLARSHDYDEELIFEKDPHGFLFGDKKRMFFVPCYNIQNGCYDGTLTIYYNGKEVLEFEPEMECREPGDYDASFTKSEQEEPGTSLAEKKEQLSDSEKMLGKRTSQLLERTGLSRMALAAATGMDLYGIDKMIDGEAAPGLDTLVLLADFFAVPADFLLGRCSREEAEAVLRDYPRNFMALRRAPYESYLAGRVRQDSLTSEAYEEPWPYNLYHSIFGKPADTVFTKKQEAGLDQALGFLKERDRSILLDYAREGMTIPAIGRDRGYSVPRIFEILEGAMKTLRSPAIKDLFKKEERTDMMPEGSGASRVAAILSKGTCIMDILPGDPGSMPIEKLDLSTRAFHGLKRAGVNTLRQLIDFSRTSSFYEARGLGITGRREVLAFIRKFLDENLPGTLSANFVSIWDGGQAISTKCRVDFNEHRVLDVHPVDAGEFKELEGMYVSFDGRQYTASADWSEDTDFYI